MKNTRIINLCLLALCAMPMAAQTQQEVCMGESVTLTAVNEGAGYYYRWNTGQTSRSINVDVTAEGQTVYTCTVTKNADANRGNLLTQGGFEFPPSNPVRNEVNELGDMITYNYLNFDGSGKDIGQGCTTTARNANDVKTQYFSNLPPHSGNWLLVCDGSSDANAQVWSARNLKLNGGETYEFSCWVANIDKEYSKHGPSSLPKLKFVIERHGGTKETLLEFTAPEQTGVWEQQTAFYTPASDMSCNIYIVNYTTYYEGNDFALDDIQFRSTKQDVVDVVAVESFTIVGKDCTVPTCRADLIYAKWSDVIFCSNASGEFTAYQWYKDSVAIEGAVKQYYYNPTEGLAGSSYMVKAVKASGEEVWSCSMDYAAIPRSADAASANQVAVSVHGRTVTVEQPHENHMSIKLVNMVGVTLWQTTTEAACYTFDADAASGTYVLSVQTPDGRKNEKIVLAK